MPLPWEKSYSVGIQEIDGQHQKFIGILNSLYQALESLRPQKELGAILSELIAYATLHFQTEERYFDLFNYSGSTEHKERHRELAEKLLTLQKEYASGKKDITNDLVDFLENWLVDHLATQDQKYVACFKEHGLV